MGVSREGAWEAALRGQLTHAVQLVHLTEMLQAQEDANTKII